MTDDVNATEQESAVVEQAAPAPAQPAPVPSAASDKRENARKVREGLVASASMNKTAVVTVTERVRDRRYGKTVRRTKRLYVHDEEGTAQVGDRVRVAETRPLSKLKRWRLVEVMERAR